LSSAQKSQKVVAVVDPGAAKFGDGVNIGVTLTEQQKNRTAARWLAVNKHSPQEPRTLKRTQTVAKIIDK
jgi:hypothetical protein